MQSGSFVGITPCPCYISQTPCKAMANVYDINGSGSSFTSICTGYSAPGGTMVGPHQQYFGAYYLNLVNTGSGPV
jgi:hypothetical protein